MCRMIVMIVVIVVIVVITVAMTAMIVTMMITAPTTTDVMIAIAAMIARNTPIIITGIIHNLARNPTTITEDDPIIIIIIIITQPSHPPLHFFSRQLPTFLLFHPFLHLLPYTLPANSSRQLPPFLFFSRQPRFSRQFFIRITHFLRQLPRGK